MSPSSSAKPILMEQVAHAAREVAEAELRSRLKGHPSPQVLSHKLAEGLRDLNALLTTHKRERRGDYLAQPPLQLAYLVHHLPIHAAKVAALVQENLPQPPPRPLTILDLGAGPLSASIGALMALPTGPARVHAVDLAGGMMRLGQQVLRKLWPDVEVTLQTASVMNAPALAKALQPHLVVMANVVGELGDGPKAIGVRAGLLSSLIRALPPESHVLVLEPGTRIHGQGLSRVREELLAAGGVNVWAPCVGQPACPLVAGNDWCHADRQVAWPTAYLQLARAAGLAPERLKFSYLWLSASPPRAPSPGLLRIIGGPMRPGDARLLRYACGPAGRVTLATRDVGPDAQALGEPHRGALLTPTAGIRVVREDAPAPASRERARERSGRHGTKPWTRRRGRS